MASNPIAAAAARKKAGPKPAPKPTATKKAVKKSGIKIVRRADYPYEAIAKAYNDGKTATEIADHFKLYASPGSKPSSKYARIGNILTRLAKGVKVNDKTIKIKRG